MENYDNIPASFQQSRMQIIKMAPNIPTPSQNDIQKREPLLGALQDGANRISSAANSWYTNIANMGGGGNNGGSSGGSGSPNKGGSSNSGGSSGNSGNSGSSSGSSNSGGNGSSSGNNGGSSSSSGSSSSGGSNSNNSGNNNSGSSSNNSGNSGSSSGNSSSGSSGNSGQSNNNSGASNGGSTSNNNNSGSNSNGSSSNSNQNSGTGEKSTANNDANGSTPATPVTLSNGAVVTPIAIVNQSNSGSTIGTNTASQSILVVLTNSQGQKITSTLAFDSSIAALAASATDSPVKNEKNSGTSEVQTANGNAKSGSTNVGMIAGPVIAVLICAIGALALFFCLRRRRRERSISSYESSTPSRSLRRFIPTFRSPGFGPIRLPSLPSFNLHNTSPQSPEMAQPFNTVISRPQSELASPMEFGRMQKYNRFVNPFNSNDPQNISRPQSSMSATGLQITGMDNSPKDSNRSLSVPESVYFSPPSQAHHPRLSSINDAINSGELVYDDDASSLGHESQGVGSAGSETAERRSYASTMMFTRAIGHSESHKALSSMVDAAPEEVHQDPFSSPTQNSINGFEMIQTGSSSNHSPLSLQSSFQANESVVSRDTFGIPSSPMSEKSDSTYGFANPGIPSTILSAQIGTKALLSPFRNLLTRPEGQSLPSFTSIVEEDHHHQEKGVPDQIKNNMERKRQLSIFRRD